MEKTINDTCWECEHAKGLYLNMKQDTWVRVKPFYCTRRDKVITNVDKPCELFNPDLPF